MTNRILKTSAAALALATALPLMAQAEPATVTAALYGEPSSLDPIYDANLPALNIYYNIFDRLATIDNKGDVQPNLAKSWKVSDDAATWDFTLNPGMTCSNGEAMDSADVKFTFDTSMADKTSKLAGYLTMVDSVEAPSPDEVVIKLKQGFAAFDRQVSLVPIVCEDAYKKMGKEAYSRAPVGSGPYELESWKAADSITLKRFAGYWGKPGTAQEVVFKPIPDDSTRASAVQSGDVDIALLGPAQIEAVEQQGKVSVVKQDANRVVYAGFNSHGKWLGDPDFRKAIDLSIDRSLITKKLLKGAGTPTAQLVAPVTFGYDPSLKPTAQDLEKAKQMVKASGYDGTPIPITYPTTGLPLVDQLAQAVAYFMNEAGIKTTLDPEEQNTFFGNWYGKTFKGVYIFAFAPSVMDAHLPFYMLLARDQQGYTYDDRIDELMKAEVSEGDAEKRAADFAEISKIAYDKTIYAPLFTDSYVYGVAKDVQWTPRPDGMMVFR